MQKVNFYLLPFVSFDKLTDEAVYELIEIIDDVKKNDDSFIVPNSFYSCEDEARKTFLEFLDEVNDSKKRLLMDMICCNTHTQSSYDEVYKNVLSEFKGYVVQDKEVAPKEVQEYVVCEKRELPYIYRLLAKRIEKYEEYYLWRRKCFPQLLFTRDAFDRANRIGTLKTNVEEITKCLGCLNDSGQLLYREFGEREALSQLQALSSVSCTGKGANETSTFKKEVEITDKYGVKIVYSISCIPHFKLEAQHSDKRIYFSWGQEQISNHLIIVVHIGTHWSSTNEEVSSIEDAQFTSA